MKHLETSQVRALLAAAEGERNRLFLTIIYEHGLRVSEALSLTRAHVRRGYLAAHIPRLLVRTASVIRLPFSMTYPIAQGDGFVQWATWPCVLSATFPIALY